MLSAILTMVFVLAYPGMYRQYTCTEKEDAIHAILYLVESPFVADNKESEMGY